MLLANTATEDPVSSRLAARPVGRNASFPCTLNLAKRWIEHCVKNHPECRWRLLDELGLPSLSNLPCRVIDVGFSAEDLPRLVQPRQKKGRWVALSHRWGELAPLRTLNADIVEMKKGITHSKLPETFRDAITITRHLGLRYIWIDFLCIIQDSTKDWLEQSVHMPNVYRNAYLTIAAGSSEHSNAGIFVDRAWMKYSKPIRLHLPLPGLPTPGAVGAVHFDVAFDVAATAPKINVLAKRAWCFQESQLSHRLLTFEKQQMSYTCLRHGMVECRERSPEVACEYRNKFLYQFEAGASELKRSLFPLRISWYNVLTDFTSRELTVSDDKLVAIAGVASILGSFTNDEYHAGIWQKDMPEALLWSPYEEETLPNTSHKATLPGHYRAPSWSWASINGPISTFLCRELRKTQRLSTITLLEMSTTLIGPDVYGQVSTGHLKIEGPIKEALVDRTLPFWPEQPGLYWKTEYSGSKAKTDNLTHAIFDTVWPKIGTSVWCLQISANYGLVLRPRFGGLDVYSRIGIFHLRTSAGWHGEPNWFESGDIQTITIV